MRLRMIVKLQNGMVVLSTLFIIIFHLYPFFKMSQGLVYLSNGTPKRECIQANWVVALALGELGWEYV
jgi:hypothetical protein